ncbi:MAG: SRPBCC family protein [Thermohalobaculum sp.]|nr:SRPBCC family protein [Thermohalobaculum sp.]
MSEARSSVSRSVTLKAPVGEVWAVVGDFQGLDTWHPAVTGSAAGRVADEAFRILTLGNGAQIVEHLESAEPHAYRYGILRGPLPVAEYHAVIAAEPDGAGTRVTWSSQFRPTAPDADEVIAGVYEAGLAALSARFGG